MMHEDFIKYGRMLFEQGLNNSHSGNMSRREEKWIYVTRHGARLGDLTAGDIVKVNLEDETRDKEASLEVKVHRAVYGACPRLQAIAHAHPPYGVVLSLKKKRIVPIDEEGRYYLPMIPVLCCRETIGSDEVAAGLPALLDSHKAALVRGHGAFAGAPTLEEAAMLVSVLESASRIVTLASLLK
jgi:L-fuculose-phosphate aldolase